MKTTFFVVLAAAVLSACSTMEEPKPTFQQAADAWVGKPETALLTQKGQPAKTITRAYEDGQVIEKTLEYQGAAALDSLGTAGVRYRPVLINGQWVQLPDQSVADATRKPECTLRFKVSAAGIVSSWSAEGPDCK